MSMNGWILKLFWPQGLPKFEFTKLDIRGAAAVAHKQCKMGKTCQLLCVMVRTWNGLWTCERPLPLQGLWSTEWRHWMLEHAWKYSSVNFVRNSMLVQFNLLWTSVILQIGKESQEFHISLNSYFYAEKWKCFYSLATLPISIWSELNLFPNPNCMDY